MCEVKRAWWAKGPGLGLYLWPEGSPKPEGEGDFVYIIPNAVHQAQRKAIAAAIETFGYIRNKVETKKPYLTEDHEVLDKIDAALAELRAVTAKEEAEGDGKR